MAVPTESYIFDGVDGYIDFEVPIWLTTVGTGAVGMGGWFKPIASSTNFQRLIGYAGTSGGTPDSMQIDIVESDDGSNPNKVRASTNGPDGFTQTFSDSALTFGTWLHLYTQRLAGSGALELYVNGVLVATLGSGNIQNFNDSTGKLTLGAGFISGAPLLFSNTNALHPVGYAKVLTSAEILKIYSCGLFLGPQNIPGVPVPDFFAPCDELTIFDQAYEVIGGNAGDFDGVDDRVELGPRADVSAIGTGDFFIEATIVSTKESVTDQHIVESSTTSAATLDRFGISLDNSGNTNKVTFFIGGTGGATVIKSNIAHAGSNKKIKIKARRTSGTMFLEIDDVVQTDNAANTEDLTLPASGVVAIGASPFNSFVGSFFEGRIGAVNLNDVSTYLLGFDDTLYPNALDDLGIPAVDLDGIDDHVVFSDALFDEGSANFYYSFWFKTPDTATTDLLLDKRGGAGAGYQVAILADGHLQGFFSDGTNTVLVDASTTGFDDDVLHHCILQRAAGGTLNLYIDNSLDGTGSNGSLGSLDDASALTIGARASLADFVTGKMAMVERGSGVLSSDDRTALFNGGVPTADAVITGATAVNRYRLGLGDAFPNVLDDFGTPAAEFDGVDEHACIPSSSDFTAGSAFTAGFQIRVLGLTGGNQGTFSRNFNNGTASGNAGWHMFMKNTKVLSFEAQNGAAFRNAATVLNIGQLYNVMFTYNGTEWHYYLDGVNDDGSTSAVPASITETIPQDIAIASARLVFGPQPANIQMGKVYFLKGRFATVAEALAVKNANGEINSVFSDVSIKPFLPLGLGDAFPAAREINHGNTAAYNNMEADDMKQFTAGAYKNNVVGDLVQFTSAEYKNMTEASGRSTFFRGIFKNMVIGDIEAVVPSGAELPRCILDAARTLAKKLVRSLVSALKTS